jgi:formylglycine-generating enzyme required for sulfatase activity
VSVLVAGFVAGRVGLPSAATSAPPTATSAPPTATSVPPAATSVPPTATSVPPTATSVPPTATSVPPTATSVPPTATSVPPTATSAAAGAYTDRTGAAYVAVPAGGGLAAFRIGRTEVTNAQYAQCVEAGACTAPSTISERCHHGDASYAEHPVVCVTRTQARAYAAWAGGALPTEAQWLRACQGDDGRTYPWGEAAPDVALANYWETGPRDTTPVGSYPAGASPYGVLDMAGNVWEWVEPDDGDDGRYIVRGGAFSNSAGDVVCGARVEGDLDGSFNFVGFRVVSPGP